MIQVLTNAVFPIFFLIGLGYLSRRSRILKQGDERVFSAYVFYFALPAFFLANLSSLSFSKEVLRFIAAALAPTFAVMILYLLAFVLIRFERDLLFKLLISTVFGSYAFFGVPFILFAFPGTQGEALAALSSSVMAMVSVGISITVLEVHKQKGRALIKAITTVARSLSKNPLILSVLAAFSMSLLEIRFPTTVSHMLHMLGATTSTVAIFMLGVFLYGRNYSHLAEGFFLALPRVILLPALAVIFTGLIGTSGLDSTVIIMMSAMPVAISTIVLSERYDFYKETVASLILFSSLGAIIYLPVWFFIAGAR